VHGNLQSRELSITSPWAVSVTTLSTVLFYLYPSSTTLYEINDIVENGICSLELMS
jgi:hypothetical protein